jgi:uncharacterized protein YjbI with pentapeptide repeats
MEFRNAGEGRSVRRPSIEDDYLAFYEGTFKGLLDVESARVQGGSFVGVTGEGNVRRSRLSGVDLSESVFGGLRLADVTMVDVDVSNSRWSQVSVVRLEMTGCRGLGWVLDLSDAGDVWVEDTRLDYAQIALGRPKGQVVFSGCVFRNGRLSGVWDGTVFLDCTFENTEFEVVSARSLDLRTSDLAGASGLLTLRGARIGEAQAAALAVPLAREAGFDVS